MDSTLAFFIVGLLLVGVAVWRVKTQNATDARRYDFSDALDEFRQVIDLVEKFAPAADRLVRLKELQPTQRRAAVIEMVTGVLPTVDPNLVKWIVENWAEVVQPELKKTLADFKSVSGK